MSLAGLFTNTISANDPDPQVSTLDTAPISISIEGDQAAAPFINPETGALHIPTADGGVEIDINPPLEASDGGRKHDANLADVIEPKELARISSDLIRGIEADIQSRQEWVSTRSKGLDLLGLKIEQPRAGTDGAPLDGMSTVRSPLLLEAVLRFQANARGELLPASGPVKVTNAGEDTEATSILANALERDMNHYLTVTAPEYYPDTDRMLFMVGFGGCGFKKVYHHPIKRRPVSESVDAEDIIISNASTDMKSCARLTHRIRMRPSTMKRMMIVEAYRDIDVMLPAAAEQDELERKKSSIEGVSVTGSLDAEDRDRELYECYCELDIDGFRHKDKGRPSGLPLPYKVTIDRDSREVLEVRRNWSEDDDMAMAITVFVKYPFVPGIGFYDIGLVNILGNSANALTAAMRLMLDAGMFSNFPGFLYRDEGGRQDDMTFRVPPGGGARVKTGGQPIRDAIMPLPYKSPDGALMSLAKAIQDNGQRVGGTADMQVGEGRQDAPVGTTLALIEQASKIMDAVHKRIHAAQAEEFQLLLERFREDPEALWRHNKRSKMLTALGGPGLAADEAAMTELADKALAALQNCQLVPMADPNTSSQTSRIMKAVAVKQLQAANPAIYDARAVDERVLRTIGFDDPDSLFAPQQQGPSPPNPKEQVAAMEAQAKLLSAQSGAQDVQLDAANRAAENQQRAADRVSKERIAALGVAKEIAVHQASAPAVGQTLRQIDPGMLQPAQQTRVI